MTVDISNTSARAATHRAVGRSMWRGAKLRCPNCGVGKLSPRYLKIAESCDSCGEEMHHQQADDAPPYFTMFAVGHLVVPPMLLVEKWYHPNVWLQVAIWLPLAALLCLALLPLIKGALVGLQWALRMGGFGSAGATALDVEQARD